jgi:hypothetical protein
VSARFQVELERARYTPGDTIRGRILVLEGGASRSLEVLLEYKEDSKDVTGVATSVSTGPLYDGDLETGLSFGFELTLPQDAFPNYRSQHGELYWQLDVKSERSGRDVHERHRLEVEPVQRTAAGSSMSAGA